jgi:hypothetical protein
MALKLYVFDKQVRERGATLPYCTFSDISQTFQNLSAVMFSLPGKIFTGPQFNASKRVGDRPDECAS